MIKETNSKSVTTNNTSGINTSYSNNVVNNNTSNSNSNNNNNTSNTNNNNNNSNSNNNTNFLKLYGEKVYSNNFPPPRFGHTVNLVSQTTVLIFGGAISGHVNYTMTADLYLFNMSLNSWKKLERKF